jgi:hypothetical protein
MFFSGTINRVLTIVLFLTGLSGYNIDPQPAWKKYPYSIGRGYPQMMFPAAEASHLLAESDTWFLTGKLTGQRTGKNYQFVTIFGKNKIAALTFNFYQVSLFDIDTGNYSTFTEYDLPLIDTADAKLKYSDVKLDLSFKSSQGMATWHNVRYDNGTDRPFLYEVYLPGIDKQNRLFNIDLIIDPKKYPTAFGADQLKGVFTFYAQPDTHTYFQTGLKMFGNITFNELTEPVIGMIGHIDRQWFPLYSGIFTPTGRQHSHEWRQINLENGIDLSIWRQFDRLKANKIIRDTGITFYVNDSSPYSSYNDEDIEVEYISYAKFPSDIYKVLIPPPSKNIWMPSSHIITSKSLGMKLTCVYNTAQPAQTLPIEYFEGPATWTGIFQNQTVKGFGVFESTLGLYRDWELTAVLRDSVAHLPSSSFSDSGPDAAAMTQIIEYLNQYVNPDSHKENRDLAKLYCDAKIRPALQTLVNAGDRAHVIEILDDLEASFSLPRYLTRGSARRATNSSKI